MYRDAVELVTFDKLWAEYLVTCNRARGLKRALNKIQNRLRDPCMFNRGARTDVSTDYLDRLKEGRSRL